MIHRYSVFTEQDSFREAGCSMVYHAYRQALKNHGSFHLVLSGGKTLGGMLRTLTEQRWTQLINWRRVHVWWSDERMVPAEHGESNYYTAWTNMLSLLPIKEKKIHRVKGESETPQAAAQAYEEEIRKVFRKTRELPAFDLAILGIGSDGHTAGLFHGEKTDNFSGLVLATADSGSKDNTPLVTLSLKVLNNTSSVLFFTNARGKRRVISSLLKSSIHGNNSSSYPAALIQPRKECIWHILDEGEAEIKI